MSFCCSVVYVIFVSLFVIPAVKGPLIAGSSLRDQWNSYKELHEKDYQHRREDLFRMILFFLTDMTIRTHNRQENITYRLGHSLLSDLTENERKEHLGAVEPEETIENPVKSSPNHLDEEDPDRFSFIPPSLDYRHNHCLGPVKSQGSCGSCWAFSAVAPLEFSHCRKSFLHFYIPFSEQLLVDCDKSNLACRGGWPLKSWSYMHTSNIGAESSKFYPYHALKGTCRHQPFRTVAEVTSYGWAGNTTDKIKAALVKYGPLSTCLHVNRHFELYESGVYTDKSCDGRPSNHCVNIVGYGSHIGIKYWILRNSWGTNWGMEGYMFIQRGVNLCGIEKYVNYVVAQHDYNKES